MVSKIFKLIKKIFSLKFIYTRYYEKLSVRKNVVLIQSNNGAYDILKELCENEAYSHLTKYVVCDNLDRKSEWKNVRFLKINTKNYCKILASAQYLVNDFAFPAYFIKQDNQVYLNICNDAPLGKSNITEPHELGNLQRNYMSADYILCPNKDALEAVKNEYMLANLFSGKYIISGCPKAVCNYVFNKNDEKIEVVDGKSFCNNKKNVLLFSGSLHKNGITTAFKNLVKSLEGRDDKNYIIAFFKKNVELNKETILEFEHNDYISMQGPMNFTYVELLCQFLYKKLNMKNEFIMANLKRANEREVKRLFPNFNFSYVINFSGYEARFFNLQTAFKCKTFVWAHNNMYKEEKLKHNFHINSLKDAYSSSDKIVVVRETMKQELEQYVSQNEKDKITVVHNLNDADGIKAKADDDIEFQEDTFCTHTKDELKNILNGDSNKFINIARFSKEKGLDRLVIAFDKYRNECDENAWLIIIGGYGTEFNNIRNMVQDENGKTLIPNIVLIKSIMNPYPILNKCDMFVLSSHYEGLPMTIIEALILDKPVASTNITGPKEFLEAGYGLLVDDSEQGIVDAFKAYKNGNIKNLVKFDVNEFNANAVKEFDALFN